MRDFEISDSVDRIVQKLLYLADLLRSMDGPKSKRRSWAYLSAGSWIIRAPVFERDLWEKLLVRPLQEITVETPGTEAGTMASAILKWVTETMAKQR
jgi:hypothetical protein